MACHLFGAEPLHEPMLCYYQLESWEHVLLKFFHFIQENAFENIVCQTGGHFVHGVMSQRNSLH